ncbi:MAG: S8 family serine peptidase, partial [Clostridia bacterium]|nr:S8 family serine peptidase [Clostridia bacterium]
MKKITAILTLTVLLLTAVSAAGCFAALFFGTDTVASLSEARKNAVAASLGIAEPEYPDIEVEDECGLSRFIVKFKKDASFGEIERAFGSSGAAYGLISDGEGRFFSVRLADPEDFFDENRGIIDYYEADTVRSALSVTNDPVQMPAYEYMDVYGAWDKVTASGDIIVAVLDTGVFRKHEDLKTVNILPGYDAVNRVSGVKTDSSGHGTAVTGVIAAAANNKAGIAGVAYGVTVLPVKVSSTRSTIYSSDLINGIRFAADAGADIINLSVGGYSSSAAEQEAIDYALSKGCIVVAASGNEGDRSIAGQKCYPASYDGVISVASCNGKGKRSSFSQYNECVDVAAPGENVTVPVWDSGSSGYRQDSGTSYSAAFVSGIAALLLSGTEPGVRFGQEEFMSVIISTCGAPRNDSLGYGVINALEAAERSALPVITGVTDGGVYNEKVYIGFNRGTATLDSEPVFDGEPVVTNGKHFLEVTDGENTVSASFRVDYRPISAQYREYDGYSAFEFTSGTALLDGFPYVSGTPVTSSGSHYFRLSEGDEVFKKTVVIKASRPEIYGVENGGYYTSPVGIKVAGASKVTLDGRLAGSEIAVCESGDHVLKVYGADAETFRSVCFTVDTGGSRKTFKGDLADPLFTVDEEYGYILLYGKDLVGARVCAISSPDKIERIVELGAISSAAISGEKVYLYGENGLSVLDRAKIMTEEDCLIKVIPLEEVENCVFGGDKIYCFGGGKIYVLDVENETLETIAEPSLDCEKAVYCDGMICMLQHSGDTGVTVFDCETCGISSVDLGVRIMPGVLGFYGGYIAVGGRLYDSEGGFIRAFGCTRTVAVSGGLLFTDSRVYFIENGGIAAYCPEGVFGVFFGERINCVFCDDGRIDVSEVTGDKAADCGALPAADRETTLPEASDVYRSERFFDPGLDVISASAYGDTLFVIYNGEPALEAIPAGQGIAEKIRLRAFPTCVTAENGALCVSFAGENFIYRAPYDRPGEGEYISVPGECAKAFAFGSGIAAICGGELVLLGEETLFTGIPADTAAPALENIAVLYGKTLSVYDSSLQNLASATVSGNGVVAGGGHIAVGGRVYSASDLHAERTFKQYVIALEGDLAVTADGIYSVTDGRRFGEICCPSADLAAFFGNNFACVTDGMIIFISAEEGGLTADPELTGIAEDGFYNSPDAIGYSFGTAFLDGVPYDPAAPVGAGGHTFVLSLPFARSIVCPFTVAAKLEGIEFVEPERVMNLGDTITLRIKYLPEGTGSVRVSFDFPGEGIYVDEYGVVTANATGKYTVTAAVAEQPGLTAKCTVTVR